MVLRDVTDQRRHQQQRELADRLASLGTMAAGVAHEVNNPLAVVIANAAYIADELNAHRARIGAGLAAGLDNAAEALADLESAARRISGVISDLSTFSRPARSPGIVDIAASLDWAVRATAPEYRHRAGLIVQIGELPLVRADETRLGQVFIHLLVNAAHAISPGNAATNEITVTAYTHEDGRAAIEVADTGSGIPREVLDRIFEPFFTTRVGVGTGLGLSICRGIVASLGGELRVTSVVGDGSRFLVLLPPSVEPAPPLAPSPDEGRLRGRILVVDDEELVRRSLARILREHDVVCVGGAREALAILERDPMFDLILSDVMMPDLTGQDFYEAVLSRDPDLARRVVFATGGAITSRVDAFLRAVPNQRLGKPFDVPKLLSTVQRVLVQRCQP
jgi:two-component system cell cycle sensor histidine kinase/response regulator CckA